MSTWSGIAWSFSRMGDESVGQHLKYGRWRVLGKATPRGKHARVWCRCDCGTLRKVIHGNLKRGLTTSCGCRARESARRTDNKYTTHGLASHPLYGTWVRIQNRCYSPKSNRYSRYGGRGIGCYWQTVKEFVEYVEGALGEKPSANHSIDRVDNDRGYEPGNLRWATPKEQALNRASNRVVEMWGESRPLQSWCDALGVSRCLVKDRVASGWDIREAILTPPNSGKGVRVHYDPNRREHLEGENYGPTVRSGE